MYLTTQICRLEVEPALAAEALPVVLEIQAGDGRGTHRRTIAVIRLLRPNQASKVENEQE